MENSQHIKSVNTDARGKNRLKYKSSRQKAQRASADVYRSYKRRIGVTTAASREERVHHPHQEESSSRTKRQRKHTNLLSGVGDDRVAVIRDGTVVEETVSSDSDLDTESTFASELDLAFERNASEIFKKFYREVWHLARSLPEVLHHAEEIVDLLVSYMLSPEADESSKSPSMSSIRGLSEVRESYVVNRGTTDILHLLAILARDLRHEIHPYVHSLLLPRIIYDLLNPPLPPPDSNKQPIPLNVTIVEAAFRTISYVFRYDAEPLLAEAEKEGQDACLECLRQYYGATLAHKRDYVRRLAAESFAPMIRKLKSDASRRRHLRRVLRALGNSAAKVVSDERPLEEQLTRSQSDGVDGIAQLFFETARGVNGRLHSKGQLIIRCLLDCVTASGASLKGSPPQIELEMAQLVASAFFEKLCHHIDKATVDTTWKELFRATDGALAVPANTCEETETRIRSEAWCPLVGILNLLHQFGSMRDGELLRMCACNTRALVEILEQILIPGNFLLYPTSLKKLALQVLTASWRSFPEDPLFVSRLSTGLPVILCSDFSSGGEHISFHPAEFLARELLPHLPRDVGMRTIGRAVLSAAAKEADSNPSLALRWIFCVCSTRPKSGSRGTSDNVDDSDDVYFVESATECQMSAKATEKLLDVCLLKFRPCEDSIDREHIAQLCVAARCLPFVVLAGPKDDLVALSLQHKRIWNWTQTTLRSLSESHTREGEKASMDTIVAECFVLESAAKLVSAIAAMGRSLSDTKEKFARLAVFAEELILFRPHSVWVLKSVAALLETGKQFHMQLTKKTDEVFDALTPNLRVESHFIRLHSLQILESFPRRPYVTDHARMDWTDELDEEPSAHQLATTGDADGVARSEPIGLCDILSVLLDLESIVPSLSNERRILACISRVEVLGKAGKLPVAYAEMTTSHMLGILNIKFAPIWPAAVRALVVLASGNETAAWEPLKCRLKETAIPPENSLDIVRMNVANDKLRTFVGNLDACVSWDQSRCRDADLFSYDLEEAEQSGRVSRHLCTDKLTVFESVWSVLENAPELAAKHSRDIVPLFLGFLHSQYYNFHDNEPDARELCLYKEIEDAASWPRKILRSKELHKKLHSYLKTFAAVNGPRQLYKHSLLLSIFLAFLSHQQTMIAQSALACVLKFKLPHVMPYADHLSGMLKRGELRDTMLRFDISKEGGTIDQDHRRQLILIITRILFGRLSSRVSVGKSSKETPAARRAAVLSFLSVLDEASAEFYPLFYLMIRSYVPCSHDLKVLEIQDESDKKQIEAELKAVKSEGISHLADQRHEGFLNLLSAVVSQLGHSMERYTPAFISVILALCKYSEIKPRIQYSEGLEAGSNEGDNAIEKDLARDRRAAIRTLCFRRLADCFDQYAGTTDFLPYAIEMWSTMDASIRTLPAAAATAEKAPALLVMLQRVSSHPFLIPMLQFHDTTVKSVIECIAKTSYPSVMNASLTFLENLLTNGQTSEEDEKQQTNGDSLIGASLIRKHINLLLHRFSLRLGPKSATAASQESSQLESTKQMPFKQTRWRELSLLCRVSRFFVEDINAFPVAAESNHEADFVTLCDLLVPFLGPSRNTSETDQLNVVEILSVLIPRVGKDAALSHLSTLSTLIGPHKARSGIESLLIRNRLASLILTISDCPGVPRELEAVADKVVRLCSNDRKRVDEMDYDKVIPILNELSEATNWGRLVEDAESGSVCDVTLLAPLIKCCSHFIYNDDGVVSRGASKALKSLFVCASGHSVSDQLGQWTRLIETLVVPDIRSGLSARSQQVRRLFILLLSEVSRCYKNNESPNLYGDLNCLTRDDEPDLDFFLNITHVQLHRRTRALQRLRKILDNDGCEKAACFSVQSLSNVLLPVALHPIYESKTKMEEPLALEAIETVSAIAKHLSWSKYHSALWTALTQFDRHPEQERYIIGLICCVIDAFHFDVFSADGSVNAEARTGYVTTETRSAVWRALENRIIPRTESLLMKEKVNRHGDTVKKLRPTVVLALLKLFQKLPDSVFDSKLPRLLAIICDGLKNRDSDARDVARSTLARMVLSMDMKYLSEVLRHLVSTLKEGYQLHVRMATLHAILLSLSSEYECPATEPKDILTPFDQCISEMMYIIQQDLFGEASERRGAEGAQTRYVKEASGSKANDSIELICRLLYFRPSRVVPTQHDGATAFSSIHAVVRPLLERLRTPNLDMATIGRIRECLNRVVVGLSQNPSTTSPEVFPFIFASISPFIGDSGGTSASSNADDLGYSDSEDQTTKIRVSSTNIAGQSTGLQIPSESPSTHPSKSVVEWRPSVLKSSANSKVARETKVKENKELHRVKDGASAPKLTGSARYSNTRSLSSQRLNDPASVSAVVFGLNLLNSMLKKAKLNKEDSSISGMLDPFIPILTICVCECKDNDVILRSFRCLGALLRMKLPSAEKHASVLGTQTLLILTSSGALSNVHHELTQACFKTLTLLISLDTAEHTEVTGNSAEEMREETLQNNPRLPLNSSQMQVLISLLNAAMVDSDHHNPTFGLIKAITGRRYVSPEFYDLMESCFNLSVRSHKASVREMSSGIFMRYLLDYPMGKQRLEDHLKQIVLNIKYEFDAGRLSAIGLVSATVEKLPIPVLEEHAQLLFLPLVLQLVNDESKQCREAVAQCLKRLLERVPLDVVQSFYDYTLRWSQGTGPLQRTSLQLFGIFVDARLDFLKRADTAVALMERMYQFLQDSSGDEWEIQYFALICLEKMQRAFTAQIQTHDACFPAVVANLVHSHPWIKQVSSRIVAAHLAMMDPKTFADSQDNLFVKRPGLLYEVSRNLCTHLSLDEAEQNDELSAGAIKALRWLVQAMMNYPELCFETETDDDNPNPVKWLVTRLSQIAKPKGVKRRSGVFKCFAAFATYVGSELVLPHLELMLEPLCRSIVEAENKADAFKGSLSKSPVEESEEATLARDVMQVLEECCSDQTEMYLQALANVKTKAREKKENRKQQAAAEAVRDPEAAAWRKSKKQDSEKRRRKRRVQDRRLQRGGVAKRRRKESI